MRPERYLIALALALTAAPWQGAAANGKAELVLHNNPFSRPEILKRKPPPPPAAELDPLSGHKFEPELTATMVSARRPMVVVDGELLGIGDRIEGYRLVAVMEGKAVFRRNGRKYTIEIAAERPNKQGSGELY